VPCPQHASRLFGHVPHQWWVVLVLRELVLDGVKLVVLSLKYRVILLLQILLQTLSFQNLFKLLVEKKVRVDGGHVVETLVDVILDLFFFLRDVDDEFHVVLVKFAFE